MIRGQSQHGIRREAGDPLDAEQILGAIGCLASEERRHRVAQRSGLAWMHADLGRQFGVDAQGSQREFGQSQPLVQRRHGNRNLVRAEMP